ncbi:MAG: DUF4342 domain-containing protein [Firmicutes bacterium]|nr:DUF4342 domain-containing protein [Bacillota bacterium]
MEITLEKIELVKDRTGVSYKEAKDALERADGSVVDAIIEIEETIDISSKSKLGEQGSAMIDKIKDAIRKGNISKITIKKDEEVILNLPVNIGLVGTLLFPWAVIASTIAALGTKCTIELLKDDGEVINLSDKAAEKLEIVVEKSGAFAEDVKEKGAEVFYNVKDKASEAMNRAKDIEILDTEDFEDTIDEVMEMVDELTEDDGLVNVDDEEL